MDLAACCSAPLPPPPGSFEAFAACCEDQGCFILPDLAMSGGGGGGGKGKSRQVDESSCPDCWTAEEGPRMTESAGHGSGAEHVPMEVMRMGVEGLPMSPKGLNDLMKGLDEQAIQEIVSFFVQLSAHSFLIALWTELTERPQHYSSTAAAAYQSCSTTREVGPLRSTLRTSRSLSSSSSSSSIFLSHPSPTRLLLISNSRYCLTLTLIRDDSSCNHSLALSTPFPPISHSHADGMAAPSLLRARSAWSRM